MCTTGTNGFLGCITSETPVAKNGLPANSSGRGGRMPRRWSSSAARPSACAPAPGALGALPRLARERLPLERAQLPRDAVAQLAEVRLDLAAERRHAPGRNPMAA